MPTPLVYTPDNTPPSAIPMASQAQPNVAPTAVALAATTGTAAAPAAVPLDQAHDNTAPVALAVPANVQSNVAPTAVALVGVDPTGAAPAALTVPLNELSNVAPTAIALADTVGTDSAPQAIAFAPIVTDPTDSNMHTAALNYVGKLTLNQIFGFYKAPAAGVIKSVQLFAQTAPTGADVIIELVDADGISLGRTATLPAGQTYADVQFGTPLNVLGGAIVRAKVTQVGSGNPGGYLSANLVVQLT